MKIGLIGINKYAKFLNFACDLHIYGFQQFLKKKGYDSTILDYKPVYFNNFNMRHPAKGAERNYRKAVERNADNDTLNKLADLALGFRTATVERERRFDKFEAFARERLKFTDNVYDSDLLEIQDPGFDCYICVTDVIWQSLNRHDFDRGFMLGSKAFEGKQKIAYAASRGASKAFNEHEKTLFFNYLDDIDTISVRESDFSEYIESNSNLSAPLVLDPVLLHDADFWRAVSIRPKEERFVALYYVMEQAADTIDKAVEYAKLHDLTIVELSDRPFKYGKISDPDVKHVSRYDVGMEEFLGYIEYADAVFTNSFHGCCFSMLFETDFYAGRRNGEKVPNFLATFGLTNRRFGPETPIDDLPGKVDFKQSREKLDQLRAESEAIILNALEAAEERYESGAKKDVAAFDRRRKAITYPTRFHSGNVAGEVSLPRLAAQGIRTTELKRGGLEYYSPGARMSNDGSSEVEAPKFSVPSSEFVGWNVRVRVDNRWLWYLTDGSLEPSTIEGSDLDSRKMILKVGGSVPHFPLNHISMVVFVGQWRQRASVVSGLKGLSRLIRK